MTAIVNGELLHAFSHSTMKPTRRPSMTAEEKKIAKLRKERAAQQALFIKQAEEAKQRMIRQGAAKADEEKTTAEKAAIDPPTVVDGNGPVSLKVNVSSCEKR